jgi:hypothetical protein
MSLTNLSLKNKKKEEKVNPGKTWNLPEICRPRGKETKENHVSP